MRRFLLLFLVIAFASWAGVAYVIYFFPPKEGDSLVLTNIFYLLLLSFIALGLTFTFVFYFGQNFFLPQTHGVDSTLAIRNLFRRSARRGLLLSVLAVSLISFNIFNILNLINAALIIGIAILAELYFSNR